MYTVYIYCTPDIHHWNSFECTVGPYTGHLNKGHFTTRDTFLVHFDTLLC